MKSKGDRNINLQASQYGIWHTIIKDSFISLVSILVLFHHANPYQIRLPIFSFIYATLPLKNLRNQDQIY